MINTVPTTSTRSASGRRPPRSRRAALATTVVPLGTAAGVVAVMRAAASPSEGPTDVGISAAFLAWNLLPVAGSAALLLWAGRRGWLPYAAAALGSVVLAALTAQALHDFWTSASSTSALMFIFLPLMQWTVVFVAGGLAVLGWWWSRRGSRVG